MAGNKLNRRTVLKSAAAVGALSIAGCAENTSGNSSGVRIALNTDPTAEVWNTHGGITPYWTNVMEPLVWVNQEMDTEPWLATDWEQTSETTWEFAIREGVSFHNGDKLTADHVVYSFETLLSELAYAPGWLRLEGPESIVALDEYTVEFTTTEPFSVFPGNIAHNMVCIQHPDRNPDENRVIGTGPYQVDEVVVQQEVVTSSFDDYWNDAGQVDELVFEVIEDPNTRSLSLENDEIDIGMSPPRSQIDSLESNDGVEVARQETAGSCYGGFNLYDAPTDDPVLRRALNHAVDQQLIVDTILENVGSPARVPISPTIYWSAHDQVDPYEYDEDTASSLVEESAYGGEMITIVVPNDLVNGRDIAQVLLDDFTSVGVEAEIQMAERAQYSDLVRNGNGHLFLDTSGSNSGAADYVIYDSFHSDGDVNQRRYRNEETGVQNLGGEVDTLIEDGLQATESAVKEEKYVQAQERMKAQAVTLPVYYDEFVAAYQSGLEGVSFSPIPEFTSWTSLEK
ncbi:ABC transporter substrate-binding protein [Halovivax asiaticus]|uniref:ABC transporter substrate-binding protein n=1 Tax=Halovivax asiaticus TaxID=332953 RepID=UPI000677AEE6|nr:ABC transporter substrate-binding protein [Halovivax asiaticus]